LTTRAELVHYALEHGLMTASRRAGDRSLQAPSSSGAS
jgi:hypothetical protein